jgi:hypothetical protein
MKAKPAASEKGVEGGRLAVGSQLGLEAEGGRKSAHHLAAAGR